MYENNTEKMDMRTELHMLTEMSDCNGVSGIREILETPIIGMDIWALAITDINNIQAFPDAVNYKNNADIRLLYGMTATVDRSGKEIFCMLIARNEEGKQNLFSIVTEAYKKENDNKPVIEWDFLERNRKGLFVGASCDGEITEAVCVGKPDEEIRKMIKGYDYIEIQPRNNMTNICDETKAEAVIRRIVNLADKEKTPVVAVSNAAFILPEDQICHEVLTFIADGEGDKRPRYLRNTPEMLEEFSFLGEDRAREVVLDNPNRIAKECGDFSPMTDNKYPLHFPDEDNRLREICFDAALRKYGDPLPDIVISRLDQELSSIRECGYSGIYLFWKLLTDRSKEQGYPTGSRGSVGASLVAFFCGITDVNPLPAHYYCPKCHKFELFSNKPEDYWYTGYDIPEKECPDCGSKMYRDGFNIPFELFAGLDNDREPDIDINFASNIQDEIMQYVEDYFGEENVVRAGTISTIPEKTAALKLYEYAEKTGNSRYAAFFQMRQRMTHHFDDYGFVYEHEGEFSGMEQAEFKRGYREWEHLEEELVKKISGTKRGMGIHPGGIIIIPKGIDMNEITPVQYKKLLNKYERITHLDYHSLEWNVMKYDILRHDTLQVLHDIEEKTGKSLDDIPYDDEKVLSLFQSAEALGFKERKVNGMSCFGTLGIPEFGSVFAWELLASANVEYFSDLMRISALQHGTDCWIDNAEKLVSDGKALKDVISYRDDIMLFLESKGMEREYSYRIMENVRKGKRKWRNDDYGTDMMRQAGVPEWYIASCNKIGYLFPKAHTAGYVKQAWKLAYYKLYYPEEFYSAVLRFKLIPKEIVNEPDMLGIMIIHMEEDKDNLSHDNMDKLRTLYLLAEARDRGCDIRKIIAEAG